MLTCWGDILEPTQTPAELDPWLAPRGCDTHTTPHYPGCLPSVPVTHYLCPAGPGWGGRGHRGPLRGKRRGGLQGKIYWG